MKRDFTLKIYEELLDAMIEAGYSFQTFRDYLKAPEERVVILRHDVDRRPGNALQTAEIEHAKGLEASYYFRMVPEFLQVDKLLKIKALGHEIGYHYEDMDPAKGDAKKAIVLFEENLAKLRKLAPIETICMHGSPLSKYDNRELWKHYDYRDYGIIGEPYFDLDYDEIFYITDTGRRWNNAEISVRDKVQSGFDIDIQNTFHMIELIENGALPPKIMINSHTHRWFDSTLLWLSELVFQNLKNEIKRIKVKRDEKR